MTALAFLRRPAWVAAGLFVLVASAWIAHRSNTYWDYTTDAGPPIDDLVHLRLHAFLADRPAMGPLSLIYRAPFAALGQALGTGGPAHLYLDDSRFGVFACLVPAGIFGIALGRQLELRGRSPLACAAVVVLSLVNPVSLRAVHFGHSEEVLGAALMAGAMLAAVLGRPWLAAVLLALTVANKQWGLVALPAIVVVLAVNVGWERLRGPALALIGIGLALLVPLLIVDAGSLIDETKALTDLRGTFTFPADIWYAVSPESTGVVRGVHDMQPWVGLVARPLIVALGVALPLLYARRLREDLANRAFSLLALVMLLRCALDPADNGYYHVPFMVSVLAADGLGGRRFWATAAAAVLLQAPTTFHPSSAQLNAYYCLWATLFAVYLAGRAYGLDWPEYFRSRGARGRAAAPSPRSS